MSKIWPLKMSPTDKLVLMALADAANDEESHTWIAVKSRVALNRAGNPKLNLMVKTSYSERTVQAAIQRLEKAGHITREEKPGIGCDYWIHPVAPGEARTPAANAGVRKAPTPAALAPTPAANAGHPRRSCGETLSNPNQPSAGARGKQSRSARSPAGPLGGPASTEWLVLPEVVEKKTEGVEGHAVRAEIIRAAGREPDWLHRSAIQVDALGEQSGQGPFGVTVVCPGSARDIVDQCLDGVSSAASFALAGRVNWCRVQTGEMERV